MPSHGALHDPGAGERGSERFRVGIVESADFLGFPAGGATPTIEIFLKFAQDYPFDIHLFGMSTRAEERVGHTYRRRIGGVDYPFTPLFYVNRQRYSAVRPIIPIRVRAITAYWLRRAIVDHADPDVLYLNHPETLPFVLPKRTPVVYHLHSPHTDIPQFSRYPAFRSRWFIAGFDRLMDILLRRSDAVVTIEPASTEALARRFHDNRIHLIPTSADVGIFRPLADRMRERRNLHFDHAAPLLVFAGRLSRVKGIDLILTAFEALLVRRPRAILAIAGQGEQEVWIRRWIESRGLGSNISLLGMLDRDALAKLYGSADAVLCASANEPLGLVVLEALACGTPVVATDVGVASTVVKPMVTGELVHSRSPAEYLAAIEAVLNNGDAMRNACVEAARESSQNSRRVCDLVLRAASDGRRPVAASTAS